MTVQTQATFQEFGHVSELRDFVLSVAALSLQLLQAIQELSARMSRIDGGQSPVHFTPDEIESTSGSGSATHGASIRLVN